jgi:hypothetical protein
MPLDMLHEPLPAGLPHWFIAPQDSLFTSLSLPPMPLERRPSSSGTGHRSLVDSFIKIVYVDRQNSDRRFDNASHDGLMDVLQDMHEHGAKWREREIGGKNGKMKEKRARVKVDVVKFEHLNAKEQVQAVYDADVSDFEELSRLKSHAKWSRFPQIIIGIHGNGLSRYLSRSAWEKAHY